MSNLTLIESPEDLNKRFADQFRPLIIYLAVHAVLGILGNSLVLLVYSLSREYRNTTFKVFVLFLAVFDLLSCLTFIPTEILRLKNFFWETDSTLCRLKCFFNVFFNTALALALFFIAVHRYRKVCQPFKNQISPVVALRIVIVVLVTSCLLSVPAPILCGIAAINKTNIYNTTTTVQVCAAHDSVPKIVIRANVIVITLLLFLVSVSLIVLYILITRTLIVHWKKHRKEKVTCRSTKPSNIRQESSTSVDSKSNITSQDFTVVSFHKDYERETTNGDPSRKNGQKAGAGSIQDKTKPHDSQVKMAVKFRSRKPYKTLIWLFLTLVFIVTNALYVMAAFAMSKKNEKSPDELLGYKFLLRIYFFNNIVSPFVYAWLDQRFRASCVKFLYRFKSSSCQRSQ